MSPSSPPAPEPPPQSDPSKPKDPLGALLARTGPYLAYGVVWAGGEANFGDAG